VSRNNKSARLIAEGKLNRRAKMGPNGHPESTGNKGPASTTPKHGKQRAWFQLYDSHSDYLNAQKKGKKRERQEKAADIAADAAEAAETS
jgi:hypothetical protein